MNLLNQHNGFPWCDTCERAVVWREGEGWVHLVDGIKVWSHSDRLADHEVTARSYSAALDARQRKVDELRWTAKDSDAALDAIMGVRVVLEDLTGMDLLSLEDYPDADLPAIVRTVVEKARQPLDVPAKMLLILAVINEVADDLDAAVSDECADRQIAIEDAVQRLRHIKGIDTGETQ